MALFSHVAPSLMRQLSSIYKQFQQKGQSDTIGRVTNAMFCCVAEKISQEIMDVMFIHWLYTAQLQA